MSEQTPVYTTPGCPLWVDTTNSSFNVDDPTFWTPISVISGLASGFCERMAVAKIASAGGTVETGAKATLVTGKTWTIGATTGLDLGSNNAIVSNVAHGFATGATGATLYNTHDASFQTVGTSAGANYMKAVDDAITSMVTMQSSYVDANGAAYSFTTLATAAVTRAAASGSSILTPVKDGTNSNAPFAPAYPVEWAKERKWMLDQLRYTGATVIPVTASTVCYNIIELNGGGGITELFNAGVDGTTITSAVSSAYVYDTNIGTAKLTGATTGKWLDGYTGPLFNYHPQLDGSVLFIKTPKDRANKLLYGFGFIDATTTLKVGDQVLAYCGEYSFVPENGYLVWDEAGATKLTGATAITAASGARYVLVDGATATLRGTAQIGALSVSSGCTALISSGVRIPHLNVMDGGVVLPAIPTGTSISKIQASAWFENYRNTGNPEIMSSSFRYINANTTAEATSSYFVLGATLSVPDGIQMADVYVTGTTDAFGVVYLEDAGDNYSIAGSAVVYNNGILNVTRASLQTGNPDIVRATVLSGGTLDATNANLAYVNVHSGGVVNINNCYIPYLEIIDGATVNITGNSVDANGYLSNVGELRIGTFQAFNLPVTPGWNTFTVVEKDADTGIAYVAGVSDETAGSAAIIAGASVMAECMPKMTVDIDGDTNASSLAKFTNDGYIWQNFSVLAINGGTATSTAEDHYKDFRVRQYDNYDQSETPQT